MNSKELRDMFANLLATAMNIDTKEQAHPSFVEVIKCMNPLEAIIFNKLYFELIFPRVFPLCKMVGCNQIFSSCFFEYGNFMQLVDNLPEPTLIDSTTTVDEYFKVSAAFENIERLGLIRVFYDGVIITEENTYKSFINHPALELFKEYLNRHPTIHNVPYLIKGFGKLTSFGEIFSKACISPAFLQPESQQP